MSKEKQNNFIEGEFKESQLELQKYQIDKKAEASLIIAEKKLQMSSLVKVGDVDLSTISLLADKFARSGDMIPKDFQGQPDKCFAAIYKGATLGLDAFTALQRIAVVNGRATIWGDTALALVRKSGFMTKFKEELIKDDSGKLKAICTVKRGEEDECVSEYTQEQAVTAGLWGRNVWAKYPERMLKYRARAFALRDTFADILDGLHLKEEMEGEVIDVTPSKSKTAGIPDDMVFDNGESAAEAKQVDIEEVINEDKAKAKANDNN